MEGLGALGKFNIKFVIKKFNAKWECVYLKLLLWHGS